MSWYTVDSESPLIAYAGAWEIIRGQGHTGGSVHSTTQVGATATFRWKGRGIRVWMSAPPGDWNQISRYVIDKDPVDRHIECKLNAPTFDLLNFDREGLNDVVHEIVISQIGKTTGSSRGGAPIQLDRIEVLTSVDDPNPAPVYPPGFSPSSGNSPPNTLVNTPPANTIPSNTQPTTSSRPPISVPARTPIQQVDEPSSNTPIATTLLLTLDSSTLHIAKTLSNTTPPISNETNPLITKVTPTRTFTSTDSTGGVVVHTEFVTSTSSIETKESGIPPSLLVGIIASILLFLFLVFSIIGVLWWRRRQHRKATVTTQEKDTTRGSFGNAMEDRPKSHTDGEGGVSPFEVNPRCPSSLTLNPFSPFSDDRFSSLLPDEAPPSYQLSQSNLPPSGRFFRKDRKE